MIGAILSKPQSNIAGRTRNSRIGREALQTHFMRRKHSQLWIEICSNRSLCKQSGAQQKRLNHAAFRVSISRQNISKQGLSTFSFGKGLMHLTNVNFCVMQIIILPTICVVFAKVFGTNRCLIAVVMRLSTGITPRFSIHNQPKTDNHAGYRWNIIFQII